MRNLFTSEPLYTFHESGGLIVLQFPVLPDRLTRDRIRSCGFRWDEKRKGYVRKNNFDGQNAAEYLRSQLQGEVYRGTL
jgi:hypothetical protein